MNNCSAICCCFHKKTNAQPPPQEVVQRDENNHNSNEQGMHNENPIETPAEVRNASESIEEEETSTGEVEREEIRRALERGATVTRVEKICIIPDPPRARNTMMSANGQTGHD